VAPFERVKIVLQTQANMGDVRYMSAAHALQRIPKDQGGVTAFWRGNLTNCARVVPTYALRFALFDVFQKIASTGVILTRRCPLRAKCSLELSRVLPQCLPLTHWT